MKHEPRTTNALTPRIVLDRIRVSARGAYRKSFRDQPDHRVLRSHFLWSGYYGRVLETENVITGARTCFYDLPRVPWVPRVAVVLVAGDEQGLQPAEVLGALELLERSSVTLLELAIDFPSDSMGMAFAMAHVIFGKSRWSGRKVGIMWFGTRRSAKFVRTYIKSGLGVFRIELELHASWLRKYSVRDCFDFVRLPDLVVRRQLFFCRLNWPEVHRKIRESAPNPALALRNVAWEQHDLYATLRFLRRELKFANTHRLLIPLELNDSVATALTRWAAEWPTRPYRVNNSR